MKTDWTEHEVSQRFHAYDDRIEERFGYRPLIAELTGTHGTAIRVLDYGCGGGKVSRRLKAAGVEHVTGVDIAPTMIDSANAAGTGAGLQYAHIDGPSLPFAGASFDAAISCFLFINIAERAELARVAAEVLRVLKPGGTYYVLDTNPRTTGVQYPTFRNGEPGIVYRDGDARPVYLRVPGEGVFDVVDTHWDMPTYREALQSAGFALAATMELGFRADEAGGAPGAHAHADGSKPFVLFKATKPPR
ncbi:MULTISPECIES: class I SAM-dependent methyltransferase [Burkholderia]|uniref:Methyltransferase n=1 Tax=Burkholderia savannae TaxID=1637837 RepID=A0ABR5T4W3_9BURK|nr:MULTISPECIES: class I SAM-dependent methyltransferase [Burkholderia]AOJ71571.1 methyltransferase [Burkholderia savannae]AOJ83725.1 methyltransferase [Burkholderia savannae]AOK49967.1 methyltransferase [Burkholderia sp. MSMB617WGS]KGS05271.1 ubiE/COQ5 methyltransferase family protein [Burkholderia sp. ABCPW 111]KVG42016.1 methyltransferase [Burkholderia sp. MSMB0265]